ncbi:MAG: GlcNAc-PI de-N-acetylase [SAR116 cluster bacterium]|nr:GlcNAc-PI de-N-acetylase [SAR116 cluster bacterium]RPH12331.1 MAG: PIG-L family deacetylase [Alphaproteobacteria bacterium TMED54]
MNKVLVIAAHPDDEVLGCGGVIAKHVNNGDKVDVLIAAEGITSRTPKLIEKEKLDKLKSEAERANKLLGVNNLYFEGLPDNRLDKLLRLETVKIIEKYIEKTKPHIIYTHHSGDVNIDHQILHHSVVTACRPIPGIGIKDLLFFEVLSSTEWQTPYSSTSFTPNWFVEIDNTIDLKLKSLNSYTTEMRDWPHPRSIKGAEILASHRGASIGVNYAEAFMLGRKIIREELNE